MGKTLEDVRYHNRMIVATLIMCEDCHSGVCRVDGKIPFCLLHFICFRPYACLDLICTKSWQARVSASSFAGKQLAVKESKSLLNHIA